MKHRPVDSGMMLSGPTELLPPWSVLAASAFSSHALSGSVADASSRFVFILVIDTAMLAPVAPGLVV